MVRQKRTKIVSQPPELKIETIEGEKLIRSQKSERLLGLNMQDNLSWKAHLEIGDKPLIPTIRRRLGALRHLGTQIPLKGRKLLASGLII